MLCLSLPETMLCVYHDLMLKHIHIKMFNHNY